MDDSKLPAEVGDSPLKNKVKPVLKKHHGDAPAEGQRPKKELKWDEEVIEEHDQLRGTRMKVCSCIVRVRAAVGFPEKKCRRKRNVPAVSTMCIVHVLCSCYMQYTTILLFHRLKNQIRPTRITILIRMETKVTAQ